MKKALFITDCKIVESIIRKVYEKYKGEIPYDITFTSVEGEVITFSKPDEYRDCNWGKPWTRDVLPMIPKAWERKVVPEKREALMGLKNLYESGGFDIVINGFEPEKDGQLAQAYICRAIGVNVPVVRFWVNDLTEVSVKNGLISLKPNEDYRSLEQAAMLRKMSTWLAENNFSRAASLSLDRPTKVGRIMTPVLGLLAKRENDIRKFSPTRYYELKVTFRCSNGVYDGYMINKNAEDSYPTPYAYLSSQRITSIMRNLGNTGFVESKTVKEGKIYAPKMYNLTELQRDCNKSFALSPSKTLEYAIALYEKGVITYPKTESEYILRSQIDKVKGIIRMLKGENHPYAEQITETEIEKVFENEKYVLPKITSCHPAIIPTGKRTELRGMELEVYKLIVTRFLAVFLPPQTYQEEEIVTTIGKHKFVSTGRRITDLGFAVLEPKTPESPLCEAYETEQVYIESSEIIQRQTVGPVRYDISALLLTMKETGPGKLKDRAGLGTVLDRTNVLDILYECGYISILNKQIFISDEALQLMELLKFDFVKPGIAAAWEQKLKEVELNVLPARDYSLELIKFITETTQALLSLPKLGEYKIKIGQCPKCKKPLYEIHTGYVCKGKTEGCCDFILPKRLMGVEITRNDVTMMIEGKSTTTKIFVNKDGKRTKSRLCITEDFKLGFSKNIVGKCPVCGKSVLEGKNGYYCQDYRRDEKGNVTGCPFCVYGKVGDFSVSPDHASEIFTIGRTKREHQITFPSGKIFTGCISYKKTDNGYRFDVIKNLGKVCNCQFCEGVVMEQASRYACSNYKSCKFSLPKTFFGAEITPDDIRTLLIVRKNIVKKLTFKNGSSGEKRITIKRDENYGYKYTWETESEPNS